MDEQTNSCHTAASERQFEADLIDYLQLVDAGNTHYQIANQ